jgi:hypothetical protein
MIFLSFFRGKGLITCETVTNKWNAFEDIQEQQLFWFIYFFVRCLRRKREGKGRERRAREMWLGRFREHMHTNSKSSREGAFRLEQRRI